MNILKNYLTVKRLLIFLLLSSLLVLSIVPLTRLYLGKPIVFGDSAYYNLRVSDEVSKKGLIYEDRLIYDGRINVAKPHQLLITGLSSFLGKDFLVIISILAGLISTLFFFWILRKTQLSLERIFFILLIFILSPSFIYTFAKFGEMGLSLLLISLGFYLFLKSDDSVLAPLFFFLISIFLNLTNVIVIILTILFLAEIYPEKNKISKLILIFIIVLAFIYYTPLYFNDTFSHRTEIFGMNNFKAFISDFSDLGGIGIFAFLLAIIGLFITLKDSKQLGKIYLLILSLICIGLFFEKANTYLNLIGSIFGGFAFTKIISRNWKIEPLKLFTAILLISGLLFSTISYVKRDILDEPSKELVKSLEWLKLHSNDEDIILSHYSYGLWIEYWAERPVLTDSLFNYKDTKRKIDDSNQIFYSRNLENTKKLLDKYNIKYVLVTDTMKKGLVWESEQGLLYLFRNNQTFEKIYNQNNIEIWRYKLVN